MHKLARFAFLSSALVLASGPVFAQDKPEAKKDDKKTEEKKKDDPTPNNGRRFGMGDMGNFGKRATEFLTKELDLDSKQQVEVKKIFDGMMADVWKKISERMQNGGGMQDFMNPDGEGRKKARTFFEDIRLEMSKKISKVLTPVQRKHFEVVIEQFDRRANEWENSRKTAEDPSQLFNPAPLSKRLLLAKAERSLFVTPEEAAAIMPFVEKVINSRQALYEGRKVRRKDLLEAARGGAKKDEIKERVGEIRAAEQFQQLELAAAQQKLRELLTIKQEARFVALSLIE